MKKLTLLLLLISSSSFALECPKLAGIYFCTFTDNTFSPFKIEQISSESGGEKVSYRMTYTNFPTGTDEFEADLIGLSDELGWVNKCSKNKLLSLSSDGSMLGKIYINREQAFVRELNGVIVQTCPLFKN